MSLPERLQRAGRDAIVDRDGDLWVVLFRALEPAPRGGASWHGARCLSYESEADARAAVRAWLGGGWPFDARRG